MGNSNNKHHGEEKASPAVNACTVDLFVNQCFSNIAEKLDDGFINNDAVALKLGTLFDDSIISQSLRKVLLSSDVAVTSTSHFFSRLDSILRADEMHFINQLFCCSAGEDVSEEISAAGVTDLFHCCAVASGCFLDNTDNSYVQSLASQVCHGSSSISLNTFEDWLFSVCPKALRNLQKLLRITLYSGVKCKVEVDYKRSSLITPFQLWLLRASLSSTYAQDAAANDLHDDFSWTLLYSSDKDGLSATRFEAKVTGYSAPTVVLIGTQGKIFAVCNDEEWRQSQSRRLGQLNACALELRPEFSLRARGSGLIHYYTSKPSPKGLIVGVNPRLPVFSLSPDFDNVDAIEVWGCGDLASRLAQQEQKKWESRQIEKAQKVPLPGQWDKVGGGATPWEENPDKILLEMLGKKMGSDQG